MKHRHLARPRSAQQGSAYIIVLLVLLLLTIFGLSLVLITHTERQIGANQRDATRNFFAAESGISIALSWLQDNNTQPHEMVVSSRVFGETSGSNKNASGLAIRDLVRTSRMLSTGGQNSNLGDVSSNTGEPQKAANFFFESSARRLARASTGSLADKDVQLAQKRIEVMVLMDPFDLRAENLYTGELEYEEAGEETPDEN